MPSPQPDPADPSGDTASFDPAPSLERFLDAYPDGDREEFEGWAQAQSELSSAPELLAATCDALERWHEAKRLPGANGDMTVPSGLSSFRRNGRVSEPEEGRSTGSTRANALRPGQRIGEFTLLRFIARGGMGEVWEADDASVRRRIALKLVLPDRVDAQSLALFAREARAGGRLNHPNLVTTLGHGTDGGLAWISQELVEGSWTVKDSLNALRNEESVPKGYYSEVARLVASIADGLQAAHDAGVIHRDLKPQNILVSNDDQPKVTDFGLARVTGDSFRSKTGDIAGTWAYMSPEQVTAKRMGMDHRTDVFSLGVVLYELLALRRPFEGDTTHQIATRILTEDARPATKVRSQCPPELSVICAKAMEKAPDRRYATMAGFAADLRRHLANEPIEARPPGPIVRSTKWVRRHPAISAAGTIAGIAFAAVSFLSLSLEKGRRRALDAESKSEQANAALISSHHELEAQLYASAVFAADSSIDRGLWIAGRKNLDRCPPALRGPEWSFLSKKVDMEIVADKELWAEKNNLGSDSFLASSTHPEGHLFLGTSTESGYMINLIERLTGDDILVSEDIEWPDLQGWASMSSVDLAGENAWFCEENGECCFINFEKGSDLRPLIRRVIPDHEVLLSVAANSGRLLVSSGVEPPQDPDNALAVPTRIRLLDDRMDLMWEKTIAPPVLSLEFNPAGDRFCACLLDGHVRVFDTENGDQLAELTLFEAPEEDGFLTWSAWSHDGRWIAVTGGDVNVFGWHAHDRARVRIWRSDTYELEHELWRHAEDIYPPQFSPTPPTRLLTGGSNGEYWIWDPISGEALMNLELPQRAVACWDTGGDFLLFTANGSTYALDPF